MKTNGTEGIPEYARSQSSAVNNTPMEKTYKRVPFDIELAKKIQSGEVEGRFVCYYAGEYKPARIICWDRKPSYPIVVLVKIGPVYESAFFFSLKGDTESYTTLFIELPEETHEDFDTEEVPTGDGSIVFLKHVPKHEFKPFDKVLVRDYDDDMWNAALFSHPADVEGRKFYYTTSGFCWAHCIHYEGNEHLVGTTNNPELPKGE